jgi:gluconolactonase
VRADGTVWFTDPSYGIDSDYEGARAPSETDGCHVYRVDLDGAVVRVADDFERPNGLAFSADERQLYIVDTRRKHIRRFDVDANRLSGGEVLAECDAGSFDGIRIDHQNRIWAAAHDGLHCFDPTDGALLGKLRLPEICANLTFGGPKGNILYVTASNTLFSIMTNCTGASYPTC